MQRQGKSPRLIRGIGDDCAILKTTGRTLVTNDAFVEGIHFKRAWTSAADAGWKALAANVSDIAAGGGVPRAALVSLELPPALPVAWLKGF
ncbi:MAG: AIR synthase related protein, partial [bacterium]